MFSLLDPWSPMYTTAALRMYVLAMRSTCGGTVADHARTPTDIARTDLSREELMVVPMSPGDGGGPTRTADQAVWAARTP